MAETCSVCRERPLRYRETKECSRCYNRRYRAEDRDKVRRYQNDWQRVQREQSEDRSDVMPEFDLNAPIAYSTAHTRVAYWRGRAASHQCEHCTEPAREWAYRGGGLFEQVGPAAKWAGRGQKIVAYSPDPMDYMPLCRSCHVRLDLAAAASTNKE